jgi:hypothetical protein
MSLLHQDSLLLLKVARVLEYYPILVSGFIPVIPPIFHGIPWDSMGFRGIRQASSPELPGERLAAAGSPSLGQATGNAADGGETALGFRGPGDDGRQPGLSGHHRCPLLGGEEGLGVERSKLRQLWMDIYIINVYICIHMYVIVNICTIPMTLYVIYIYCISTQMEQLAGHLGTAGGWFGPIFATKRWTLFPAGWCQYMVRSFMKMMGIRI